MEAKGGVWSTEASPVVESRAGSIGDIGADILAYVFTSCPLVTKLGLTTRVWSIV